MVGGELAYIVLGSGIKSKASKIYLIGNSVWPKSFFPQLTISLLFGMVYSPPPGPPGP